MDKRFNQLFLSMGCCHRNREVVGMTDVKSEHLHLLNVIFDDLGDAVVTVTSDLRILAVNRAVTQLLGYEPHELIGEDLTRLVPPQHREAHRRGVEVYLACQGRTRNPNGHVDVVALSKSGAELPASLSMACTRHQGQLYITGVLRDMSRLAAARETIAKQMSELAEANARLKQLAEEDHLTGLLNRRAMQRELQQMWTQSEPLKAPMSILLCDIDHFKLYNDTYGHLSGDRCLAAVATAIRTSVGEFGSVARFGGEEYIVLLRPGSAVHPDEAAGWLRSAVARLALPHAASPVTSTVTMSIGAAVHQRWHTDPESLLRHADDALYAAKRLRNRYVLWDERLMGW